jgi:hypothetical protein
MGPAERGRPDAAFTVHLVDVVDRVDAGLAKKAVAHILAWPRNFDLDRVLVPAVKGLIQSKRQIGSAFGAVYKAAVARTSRRGLRAAQQVRTHVEDEIRRASADVDTEALRRGSPHGLTAARIRRATCGVSRNANRTSPTWRHCADSCILWSARSTDARAVR